jgi:hypothetical protein
MDTRQLITILDRDIADAHGNITIDWISHSLIGFSNRQWFYLSVDTSVSHDMMNASIISVEPARDGKEGYIVGYIRNNNRKGTLRII